MRTFGARWWVGIFRGLRRYAPDPRLQSWAPSEHSPVHPILLAKNAVHAWVFRQPRDEVPTHTSPARKGWVTHSRKNKGLKARHINRAVHQMTVRARQKKSRLIQTADVSPCDPQIRRHKRMVAGADAFPGVID